MFARELEQVARRAVDQELAGLMGAQGKMAE